MLSPEERLRKMVREGCICTVNGNPYAVAAAGLNCSAKIVWWVAMFPEDQHHTHRHSYTRVLLKGSRFLSVRLVDGPTLYFDPYVSWPAMAEGFLVTKARWDAQMADPKARRQFLKFVGSEIPEAIE